MTVLGTSHVSLFTSYQLQFTVHQSLLTSLAVNTARATLCLVIGNHLIKVEDHAAVLHHKARNADGAASLYGIKGRVVVAQAKKSLEIPYMGSNVGYHILGIVFQLHLHLSAVRAGVHHIHLYHCCQFTVFAPYGLRAVSVSGLLLSSGEVVKSFITFRLLLQLPWLFCLFGNEHT